MDRLDELELAAVWERYLADPGDELALEALVLHYQPLVGYYVRKALARAPQHQDPEEILSFAQRGLLDALSKYRPDHGAKFETYASRRVPGEIAEGLRRADPLTRPVRAQVRALSSVQRTLAEELERTPRLEEIADRLGAPAEKVRELQVVQQTQTTELEDTHLDGTHFEVAVEVESFERVAVTMLARRITELSDRDRLFLLLYYEEGLSLTEVGARLGINDSRAGQIRREMVRALVS